MHCILSILIIPLVTGDEFVFETSANLHCLAVVSLFLVYHSRVTFPYIYMSTAMTSDCSCCTTQQLYNTAAVTPLRSFHLQLIG